MGLWGIHCHFCVRDRGRFITYVKESTIFVQICLQGACDEHFGNHLPWSKFIFSTVPYFSSNPLPFIFLLKWACVITLGFFGDVRGWIQLVHLELFPLGLIVGLCDLKCRPPLNSLRVSFEAWPNPFVSLDSIGHPQRSVVAFLHLVTVDLTCFHQVQKRLYQSIVHERLLTRTILEFLGLEVFACFRPPSDSSLSDWATIFFSKMPFLEFSKWLLEWGQKLASSFQLYFQHFLLTTVQTGHSSCCEKHSHRRRAPFLGLSFCTWSKFSVVSHRLKEPRFWTL